MPEEILKLGLDASGIKPGIPAVSELHKELAKVDAAINKINASLAGMDGAGAARKLAELQTVVKNFQTKGGGLDAKSLSAGLGYDTEQFERFLTRRGNALKGYLAQAQKFQSAMAAAKGARAFELERQSAYGKVNLNDLLKGVGSATAAAAPAATGGITADQMKGFLQELQASVTKVVAPSAGAGGGGGGKGKPKTPTKGALGGNAAEGEISRVITETEDSLKETITGMDEAGQIVSKTFDSVDKLVRTVTRLPGRKTHLEDLRSARAGTLASFKSGKAALESLKNGTPGDYEMGLGKLQSSQASAIEGILTEQLRSALDPRTLGQVEAKLKQEAEVLRAQAGASYQKASVIRGQHFSDQARERYEARQARDEQASGHNIARMLGASERFEEQERAAREQREEDTAAKVTQARRNIRAWEIRRDRREERVRRQGKPPVIPTAPQTYGEKFLGALQHSFSPGNLLLNTVKVTGWATAVTALYKSIELANHGLQTMVTLGAEQVRLEQIFGGVGGSARQLGQEVLQLAASENRGSEEAMASAREWSKLGWSRKEVLEGVRVSSMLANIANTDLGESTRYLTNVTRVYNLSATELTGTLGSMKFMNQEVMQGVLDVAGAAKAVNMPLVELQATIGAMVQRGSTGSKAGLGLRTIIAHLNDPNVQTSLRSGLGMETLGGEEGSMKSFSAVLRELHERWQGLNEQERRNLTIKIAGTAQARQFINVMDSYVVAQKNAAEQELNTAKAGQQNTAVMGTIKSEAMGFVSAVDALTTVAGNKGIFGGSSASGLITTGLRLAKGGTAKVGGWLGNLSDSNDEAVHRRAVELVRAELADPGWRTTRAGLRQRFEYNTYFMRHPFEMKATRWEEENNPGSNIFGLNATDAARAASAASGHGRMAMLYESVAKSFLPGKEGLRDVRALGLPNVTRLAEAGDTAGVRRGLAQAAAEMKSKQQDDLRLAQEKNQANLTQLQQQQEQTKSADERARIEGEINQVLEARTALMATEIEASGDFEGQAQRVLNILARQRTEAELLSEAVGQIPTGGTQGLKLEHRLAGLRGQDATLSQSIDALSLIAPGLPGRDAALQAAEQQRREVRGQISGLESARGQAGQNDDREIAFGRAKAESEALAVGRNEAEKLLQRQASLQTELNRLRAAGYQNANDQIRREQMTADLLETQRRIQERIVMLAGQHRQILIDANQAFSKSLLLGGPDELLQRAALSSLSGGKPGGMRGGQFMGMSSNLRGMYYDWMGGDAGMTNRMERRSLAPWALNVPDQQRQKDRTLAGGKDALANDPLIVQAHAAGEALLAGARAAGLSLIEAGAQVKQMIAEALAGMKPGARTVGINTGFALGGGGGGGHGAGGTW